MCTREPHGSLDADGSTDLRIFLQLDADVPIDLTEQRLQYARPNALLDELQQGNLGRALRC